MRHMMPLALSALLVLSVAPASAAAGQAASGRSAEVIPQVTVDGLVNLKQNGLSDDVLIALIESQEAVFALSADDLIGLRRRGLSDRVLIVMLYSGRKPVPAGLLAAPPAASSAMPVAVETPAPAIPRPQREPEDAPPPVPAAPVINVTQTVTQHVEQPRHESSYSYAVPVAVPVYVQRPAVVVQPRPTYWGFGGERRPDSWSDGNSRADQKTGPESEVRPECEGRGRSEEAR